jgi:hypothetical protein
MVATQERGQSRTAGCYESKKANAQFRRILSFVQRVQTECSIRLEFVAREEENRCGVQVSKPVQVAMVSAARGIDLNGAVEGIASVGKWASLLYPVDVAI